MQRATAISMLCLAGAACARAAEHPQRQVLPESVVPLHYELALVPDAASLTFTGKVAITIRITTEGPAITLNAAGLTFDHAALDGGPDAHVSLDKDLGRATLSFANPVTKGEHRLTI